MGTVARGHLRWTRLQRLPDASVPLLTALTSVVGVLKALQVSGCTGRTLRSSVTEENHHGAPVSAAGAAVTPTS